ncbi:MAG TPA: TIR domain-containing protein [Planctomycetota bacterium]|nr:TIR domain-containing protein [Planctomycetota bacterium]
MKKYHGFMSYSHRVNQALVSRLQRDVQRFGRGFLSPWSLRIFRDGSDLTSHPGLWPELQQRLQQSEYLIYLATPEAASSKWIRRELSYWRDMHGGKLQNFLVVLLDGEVTFNSESGVDWSKTTALPRWLDGEDQESRSDIGASLPDEPKYLDLRWARDQASPGLKDPRYFDVVASLAAAVQGRDKLELIYRDAAEQRRTLRTWKIASWLFMGLLGLVGWAAWELQRTRIDSSEVRAQLSDRRTQALYKEVVDNLYTADLHLGLLKVLADGMTWPLDGWSERTMVARMNIASSPFVESQLIGLQIQPELVPDDVWRISTDFYHSIRMAQSTLRTGMIALDDLHAARSDNAIVEQIAEAQLGAIEASYHLVWTRGSSLLDLLGDIGSMNPMWALDEKNLKLLHGLEKGPLMSAAKAALGGLGLGSLLKAKIRDSDPSNADLHVRLFVEARSMKWPTVAAGVVALIRQRFPDDAGMLAYAVAATTALTANDRGIMIRGIAVTGFADASAGRKAGVQAGDVLLIYQGHEIDNGLQFEDLVLGNRSGRTQRITLIRGNDLQTIEAPSGRLGLEVTDL